MKQDVASVECKRLQAAQVRKRARVARSLHTRTFRKHGADRPIYQVTHPQEFRRAFVQASLQPLFEVRHRFGVYELIAGDMTVARIDSHGQIQCCKEWVSPVGLSPGNVDILVRLGLNGLLARIGQQYAQMLGLGPGSEQIKEHIDIDTCVGGYERTLSRCLAGQAVRAIRQFRTHLDPDPLRGRLQRRMLSRTLQDYLAA